MIPAIASSDSSSIFRWQWLMLRPLPIGALALVLLWATLRISVPWSREDYRLSKLTTKLSTHSSLRNGSAILPINLAGNSSDGSDVIQATFNPTNSLYDAQDVLRVSSNPVAWLIYALRRLETAHIVPYDEAHAINNATCVSKERQSNPDQVKGDSEFWANMTDATILKKRKALVDSLRLAYGRMTDTGSSTQLPETVKSGGYGKGRGIVFTGGNSDTLSRLLLSMKFLRERQGCTLPVEVFSFPEEMTDQPGKGLRGQIEALGNVTFKTLHSSAKLETWKNFQIKGESIVKSSFREVLYLDSDNVLLADPEYLFDHYLYKATGAVLWPDITRDGPRNAVWRILDVPCPKYDWQVDSGQMIFDKQAQGGLVHAALLMAAEMQKDHEFWFKLSGGDKDTFRYAFYALGLSFTPAPHWLSSFGTMHGYPTEEHTFCGLAMFHYGLSPDDWQYFPEADPDIETRLSHAPPLFVHANLLKHSQGYNRGQTFTAVKRYAYDRVDHTLERARSIVYYSYQGMCVDLWDDFHGDYSRPGGDYNNGDMIIEDANEAFGGVLRDFEQIYYDSGGKAGGF